MNVGEWTTKWAGLYPNEPAMKCGELSLTRGEFNSLKRSDRLSARLTFSPAIC